MGNNHNEIINAARSYEGAIRKKREAFKNLMRIREEQGKKGFDEQKHTFYALSKPCDEAAKILIIAMSFDIDLDSQVIVDDILYWTDGKRLRRFPIKEITTLS